MEKGSIMGEERKWEGKEKRIGQGEKREDEGKEREMDEGKSVGRGK